MTRILIIRPGGIGDIALTIPLLVSVRKQYRNCLITFISNQKTNQNSSPIDLLLKLKLIDNYFEFDIKNKFKLFKKLLNFIFRQRNNFDISMCLRHSNRNLFNKFLDYLFFKKIINVNIGFGFWNSSDLSFKKQKGKYIRMIKESSRLINILKSEGLDIEEADYYSYIDDMILKKSRTQNNLINFKNNYVIFCPFGKPFKNHKNKNWGLDNFLNVAKELNERGFKLLLVGSKNDFLTNHQNLNKFNHLFVNLCGKISLCELLELSTGASFYLGNDTGPMHICSLTKTPIIAIFNPFNNINKFYPIGKDNLIFRDDYNIKNIRPEFVLNELIEKNIIK